MGGGGGGGGGGKQGKGSASETNLNHCNNMTGHLIITLNAFIYIPNDVIHFLVQVAVPWETCS